MERLTEKIDSEYCLKHCLEENPCSETSGICLCGECSFPENAYQKLGEYEDLEEQCVQENAWGLQMLLEKWKEFLEDIQHLYEYRELEGQGKLVKLPCAVGDTVYTIYSDEDGSFIEEPKVEEVSTHRVWIDSMYFDYDDFGKSVFFTREEAEAARQQFYKKVERGRGK